jgi:DNA-binding transcriptional MerR regulator
VRYYVQQGLPSPGLGAAPATEGHLVRLRLIRRLQSEHLPLAEIRRRLEGLDDEAVRALLERSSADPSSATSAVDYVQQILGSAAGSPPGSPWPSPPLSLASPAQAPAASSSPAPGRPALPSGADRAQWERIALTPDVEVHIRRPLSREDNRRVEKLLAKGRELFRSEEV